MQEHSEIGISRQAFDLDPHLVSAQLVGSAKHGNRSAWIEACLRHSILGRTEEYKVALYRRASSDLSPCLLCKDNEVIANSDKLMATAIVTNNNLLM